jgi:hypothetical protein
LTGADWRKTGARSSSVCVLDGAKRDGLKRKQQALLLSSYDMVQAAAAARALEGEADGDLARALETAMAVCYMRAFTKGAGRLPAKFIPRDAPDADFHKQLVELRHRVYAHTSLGRTRWSILNAMNRVPDVRSSLTFL